MDEQLLAEYGKISLPDDVRFRHIRILCSSGIWVSAKRKISNKDQWIRFLKALPSNPFKVYVSLNSWLQPGALRGRLLSKAGFLVDSQVLIKQRLLFDFDTTLGGRVYSLEQVRRDALKLVVFMEQHHKNYCLDYIQYSGKGLHVVYADPYTIKEEDVFERQETFKLRRDRLLRFLPALKTLDLKVSNDVRRVYKLGGCYDLSTGIKVSRISLDALKTKRLCSIVKTLDHAPVNPRQGNDTHADAIQGGWKSRSGVRLPPTFYKAVKNNVWGVKGLYVPMLFYNAEYDARRVVRVQRDYDLGPLVAFSSQDTTCIIGLKPLSYRRLLKVMRAGKSRFIPAFLKYKHSRFYTSELVDVEGTVLKPAPVFEKVFDASFPKVVSRPHSVLLGKYLNFETFTGRMIGSEDFKVLVLGRMTS